ncbi:hypothetical protein V8E36_000641 [Tilletia maclaganii]
MDFDSLLVEKVVVNTPGLDVLGSGADRSDNVVDKIDWGIVTTAQAGAGGRQIRYARGKTLGGCSTRNFLIYQRPSVGSHSIWQRLTQDPTWGFAERFADYKRGITFTGANLRLNKALVALPGDESRFSSAKGPLHVSYAHFSQPFSASMAASMQELGYPLAKSFNDGALNGVQYCTTTVNQDKLGIRSTSRDFYEAARLRPNLKVYTSTTAMKIIFDGKKAIGVNATSVGFSQTTSTFRARKEVILSAGAFQSPQLLMVSGIGPQAQLDKFGIRPVVINEAVGQNLQDHVFAGPTFPVNVPTLTKLASDIVNAATELAHFHETGDGPMASNTADMIAWDRLNSSTLQRIGATVLGTMPEDHPHIEYLVAPGVTANFSNLFAQNQVAGKDGRQFATIFAALVAPRSKGSVTLKSASMADLPVVDPAWLTDPVDQAVAVEAFKRVRKIFQTKTMQKVLSGPEFFPGSQVQSDEDILDFWRKNVMTVWHAASTCRMAASAQQGVIDPAFRVFGVDGLRVVDASSFPQLLPGHPQSVLYMLANRAADLITSHA